MNLEVHFSTTVRLVLVSGAKRMMWRYRKYYSIAMAVPTLGLHLLGDLVDVVLGPSVRQHHKHLGDSSPGPAHLSEDSLLHVLDGTAWRSQRGGGKSGGE